MKYFKKNYLRIYGSGLFILIISSALFFCNPKEETIPVEIPKKVLILGNSITWHPPGPENGLETGEWPLIQLHDLGLANENMALDRFENISVGSHPGDLGMERIASRIWTVLANEL